ncbi:DNA repair protein endonuclease SAE2/CtIP C-terminus-domain-containing protein [Xylaria nigripes]|nr:DNA repair protein endonuclease SAE2/CtIP C-terminus-domain-containing protein [Xylaria nigripes]
MENWFRNRGKAILLEAIEGACEQINDSLNTEYQAHVETQVNLTAELETLRRKASQVDRLTEENNALKGEIRALKEASREHINALESTGRSQAESTLRTLASKSVNRGNSKRLGHADIERLNASELRAEFLRVDQSYEKLRSTCLDLQDALHQSTQLLRQRTISCDQWIEHAKQLNEQSLKRARKIKRLEAKLVEMTQDPLNVSLSPVAGDVKVAESIEGIPIAHRQHEEIDISLSGLVENPQNQLSNSTGMGVSRNSESPLLGHDFLELSRSASALETSDSQSTRGTASRLPPLSQKRLSTEESLNIKSEPSSDTPVVVSERPVRKRKYTDVDIGNIEVYTRVKTEPSPEPQVTGARRHFSSHESIDFDLEGHRVQTPKKQTKYQRTPGAHTDKAVDVRSSGSNSTIRVMHRTDTCEHFSFPSTSNKSSSRTRVIDLAATNRPGQQSSSDPALQPLDNNQVLRYRSNLASSNKTKECTTMRPDHITSLADDKYQDENEGASKSKNKQSASVLAQILDTPSRAQNSVTSKLHFQPTRSRAVSAEKNGLKGVALAPKAESNRPSHSPSPRRINRKHVEEDAAIKATDQGETGAIPLRQTPKVHLRLDDFKINPHANEGHDYAYTDVVRKKNDRACLQGCVKEDCCGRKFRGLAKACRASTSPYEFQSRLESYLGDECHRLSTMSEDEKESLWIEAKTRELANTSGRHRHRYPRMTTPPGFWRLDFPSTQEGEEYNEEAARLERSIIEERYREAMRPGGLWIFRDE